MALSLCGTSGLKNTGEIDCDIKRGNPTVLLAGSATFTPSDYADQTTMDAAIRAKMKLQTGDSQKLFAFPVVQGVTDKTEAAKYGSLGYGLQFKLVRSKPGYEFDVLAGSSLEKRLMSYDGKTVPIAINDDQLQIWGIKDSSLNFKGASWQVGVEPRPFGDAQNAKSTKITISLVNAADFVENAFAYATLLTSFTGLKDVNISVLSNVTNVFKHQFKIPTALLGNDLNIYDDYGALISPLTFTAFSGANFATSLPITSVAVDATLKALTITYDATAYGLLTAGVSKIKLVPPNVTVLDTANVTGIEILPLIFTKP